MNALQTSAGIIPQIRKFAGLTLRQRQSYALRMQRAYEFLYGSVLPGHCIDLQEDGKFYHRMGETSEKMEATEFISCYHRAFCL